jgi:3-hydroxyacyl-CoA dehydrogenase
MSNNLLVRRAAVLGAGVMGAQIAAHLANAGVETVLFDLPPRKATRTASCRRRSPTSASSAPRRWPARRWPRPSTRPTTTQPGTAARCDLIIEAIAERMDWKLDLYKKIARSWPSASGLQHLGPVDQQAGRALPEQLRPLLRHPLLQPAALHAPGRADPGQDHRPAVLEGLEAFLTTTLGKGVVYAKDTPNFIGNRIGVFSILR